MNSVNDIKLKVNEIVNEINNLLVKADKANAELGLIEARKLVCQKTIDELTIKIAEFKDINSKVNAKWVSDKNEAERLINLNKGVAKDLEKKEVELNQQKEEFAKNKRLLDEKLSVVNEKESSFAKKEDELNSNIKKNKELNESLKLREQEAKDTMLLAESLIADANDKTSKAKEMIRQSNVEKEKANELKVRYEDLLQKQIAKEKVVDDKIKELDMKIKASDSEKTALNKQAEDLKLQELRINKILKDRVIEESKVKGK